MTPFRSRSSLCSLPQSFVVASRLFLLGCALLPHDPLPGPRQSGTPLNTLRTASCFSIHALSRIFSLQFVCVESLATALTDLFPSRLRRKGAREKLVLVIAVACFLLGLTFVTEVSFHTTC